ncbi:MAG: carbohydrate binding family 9 domain-containing protein [Croceitalea sp.]|nr:carbohydrate binding family 9 domain-containing protein [Croceitalea sp.]
MAKNYSFLLFLFITSFISAQIQQKSFTVKFVPDEIIIDGALDEPIWETADSAKDFHQYFPVDTVMAQQKTDIKMLYSSTTLYIGITMNAAGKDYIIPSLQRDFRGGGIDQISLVFDTFNDGTNAFLFGINPYGVRREALISGGGTDRNGFTTSWDVKWKGESKIYDDYYTAEIAIPLTSFKFKEGETKWRFNSYRLDMQTNERTTWMQIPQNQLIFSLAFMGDMIFEKGLGRSRTPLALIPYVNTISSKDYENNEQVTNFKVGGDAKVAIGNGMNLDITINPDFSQVEVDNFITNLTRFEISLPERRQFFVDNNDLFGSFGGGRDANPFFSRRIGIANDTADNTIENRILGGLRLSGKLNNNLRLGFLNIQTEKDAANEIPSNNNMMLALQQRVFARSNIGFFFINRQSIKGDDFLAREDEFNRVIGLDYNLASADNSWTGKFYAHKSLQPNDSKGNHSFGLNLGKNTRNFSAVIDAVSIDEEYESDLGFIPRKDILKLANIFEGRIWPEKGSINRYEAQIFNVITWRPNLDFLYSDHNFSLEGTAEFRTLERIQARFRRQYIYLTDEFEPTGRDDAIALPGDVGYNFNNYELEFQSDQRKVFSYSIEPSIGGFFNGDRYSMEARFNLRLQPKVSISLNGQYDRIELPQPYSSADIWLISPRINITFNKSVFWSNLIQYSNQRDNLGFNSRLQWRFAPLSDLFIVYNDNYFVNSFMPRSRSINLKLTYWLNI